MAEITIDPKAREYIKEKGCPITLDILYTSGG